MLFLTNILLTILVGFKIKEYLENKIPLKTKDDYADKEWVLSQIDPINDNNQSNRVFSERLNQMSEVWIDEVKQLREEFLAHKVFTTKSFGELVVPKVVLQKRNKKAKPNKTYNKLAKSIHKERSLKYTKFELEKEVLRYLKKTGEAKLMGLKAIKQIKELESKTYKRQIAKAYSRLWARQSYQLKKEKLCKKKTKIEYKGCY